MKRIVFLVVLFFLFVGELEVFSQEQTQSTEQLSLEQILTLAGAQNATIQQAKLNIEIAKLNYKISKEWWIPALNIGANLHQLNGLAMNSDGRFFEDVNRQNVYGGIGIQADWNLKEGISKTKAAEQRVEKADFIFSAERNQAILSIVHDYFSLAAAQMKKQVLSDLDVQTTKIVEQLKLQVDAGFAYRSELLLAQSKLNLTKIEGVEIQAEEAKYVRKITESLQLDESMLLDATEGSIALELNLDKIEVADRPELKIFDAEMKALSLEQKKYTTGLLLPRIKLGLSEGLFGDLFSPTNIQSQEINSLTSTFQFNGSVGWSFPLADVFGSSNKQLYEKKIIAQQLQSKDFKHTTQQEIASSQKMVTLYKEQLDLANSSIELSRMALDQSMERQKMRTARAYEVFEHQKAFLEAQLFYIEAVKKYNQAQYTLYIAKGQNF